MKLKRFHAQEYAVWIGLGVVAALVAALIFSLGAMSGRNSADQKAFLQQAVEHAAVQCYALEGAYPPDVSYLVDHYGVQYDESRFFIHYRVEGSNLRPDIEVFDTFS
ncbi:MAG: hypothetical protein LBF64_01885 [Oscillospiraceae bacterium]|jgi:hypothetical protein|nr:hypothetical protein [Oscillospiraceae bacterium]